MASVDLEYNSGFQIYNADGTKFHDLVLHKCTYETVVMSLGDKISGILYYKDNALDVTMSEYIIYKGVRYTLVNPPTILREGLMSDNSELRGMTKYSFTFYHPMYVLNNFPFSDIAVQSGQSRYLSQNKTFSWIGTLVDFVAKLNKNLEDTQWMVTIGNVTQEEQTKLSEVLSFDKNTIAEALKRGYETWEVPYVVDQLTTSSPYYPEKRFVVQYGLPATEILDEYNQPFVFQMGQGVGLKNNSRNPKNNKIITRIAGYGSEDNIPYGYPQIPYYGGNVEYPLYYGIVGGQRVQLIKHPFTRNHLMPSVYSQSVYNKVNPKLSNGSNNPNYNPNIELVDYYDANDNTYPNRIKQNSPSYEIHEFGDIKPELGEKTIIRAVPVSQQETQSDYKQKSDFLQEILDKISATEIEDEKTELLDVYDRVDRGLSYYKKHGEEGGDTYWFVFSITNDDYYEYVSYESSNYNFTATVLRNGSSAPTPDWDDTMDDDGNYLQSYFKITLPTLEFDLYACAAITQEMKINMRSGACIGCTFPVEVDWDDYKRNFYNSDGEFAPDGEQRDYTKYPDSSSGQITVMVKKELETFGTLMPNQYQQPTTGDKFVILGISLPNTYITSAEQRLDTDMKQYMRDNNVYYFDYPLKFDEHFLISHEDILSQMKNNVVVRFNYAGTEHALYIKQMSVKYNESPLPKYDITLTDDIEIVLNQIGQVTDEVSKLRLGFGAGGFGTVGAEYLRKDIDDTARGTIRMIKGMQVGERFVTGLLGEGGVFRKDSDGTIYLETDKLYVRMKAYFDTVEVKHYLHTGGNRIASQASGIVCSRVEMIDANNNLVMNVADAVLFRCFFKANDGDKTIRNDFMIGDLAFCRETNVNVSEINMHGYWRLVVGRNYDGFLTDNKEGWIDLSNRSSETLTIGGRRYTCNGYQNGSDAPIAQDDIIQLGNITDKDRQGAIIEYVGDDDAPSYQIFQGIGEDLPYPYTLEDKNYIGLGYSSQTGHAYMNVYGDVFIGDRDENTYIKYVQEDEETGEPRLKIKAEVEFIHSDGQGGTESTTMDDFIDAIKQSLEDIQDQIDGEIDTWYYSGAPTLNNAPANQWNTDALKREHIGDLYYDKDSGDAYRFIYDTSVTPNVYKWIQIHDDAITEALRLAAEAKDTADHKRRVFLTQPVPPYDQGDIWVNATYPANYTGETDESQHKYNNEILKCITAKTDEQAFSIRDWSLSNGYTSRFNDFLYNTYAPFISNIQGQVDQKAETWYQDSNPATAWYDATQDPVYDVREQHVGDIWMDTSANGGKQTYIYQYNTSTANYEWKAQEVPDEVFDYADGKCAVYFNNPTNTQNPYPTNYHEKDMWVLPIDGTHDTYTIGGVEFKAGEVLFSSSDSTSFVAAHWSKKLRYTGDERIDGFINQILNGTGASGDDATVANAISSIKGALNEGTLIDGGLVLTSVLGLRSNSRVWAGISGMYNTAETGTGYKGHGIAAWYGGGMQDWEVYYDSLTPTQQQRATITDAYAKSLFRFDGSGYLAGGNITWDKNGSIVIKNITTLSDSQNTNILNELATFNSAFSFATSQGSGGAITVLSITPNVSFTSLSILDNGTALPVATQKWVQDNYVPLAFFNALFSAFTTEGSTTPIDPKTWTAQTVINNLKIKVGTWTEQYMSAYGLNPSGGSGGGSSTLAGLIDTAISSPSSGQVLVYDGLSHKWVNGAAQSGGGIISISMSVPTGFSVSPSTISNNGGTFAITFGGTVTKNQVLASPATANGTPLWRTLVSDDIPDLSDTYASTSDVEDIQGYFTNGVANVADKLNTGNTTYTAWGRTFWTGGKPTSISGKIENASHIEINNNAKIYWKTSPSSATLSEQYISILTLDASNNFVVGESMRSNGLKTRVRGTQVYLQSGTSDNDEHVAILDENGMLTVEKLKIGNIVIEYSSQNSGLRIVNAGVYADTYFSAYGIGSGGGGGISLNQPLSGINSAGLGAPSASGSAIVWNGSSWTYSSNSNLRVASLSSLGSITVYSSVTSQYGGFAVSGKNDNYILTAGGGTKLFKLAIDSTSLEDGQTLVYDESTSSWVNGEGGTAYTLPLAASNTRGGVKIGYSESNSGSDSTRNYAVKLSSEKMYVNVPWEGFTAGNFANTNDKLFFIGATSSNTTAQNSAAHTYTNPYCYIYNSELYSNGSKVLTSVPTASSTVIGGIKIGYTTSGKNYAVQLSSNKAYVNVPWENDDTKNTAGITQSSSKLYLVGSKSSTTTENATAVTNTNTYCYIGTDNCLYSNGVKVATGTIPTKTSELTNDSNFVTTDTKNTAGIYASSGDKLYLVGSKSTSPEQSGFAKTFTNTYCYIGTDNCLYSNGSKVFTTAETGFLPLTGGTLTGNLTIDGAYLYWNRSNTDYRIYCYDPNETARYMLRTEFEKDATTGVITTTTTLSGKTVMTHTYQVANTNGFQRLVLGNGTLYSSAGSMYGTIRIYGKSDSSVAEVKYGTIVPPVLTDTRTYTLPNKSGTFAMMSDIPSTDNFLPKTGGTLTGDLSISSSSLNVGKNVRVEGSISTGGSIECLSISKLGGTASQFLKADGSVDSSNYKATTLNDTAAGTEGYERLVLGNSTKLSAAGSKYGAIRIYMRRDSNSPDKTVRYGSITVSKDLTSSQTYTLPNASGTIALTDDIVTLTGSQTISSCTKTLYNTILTSNFGAKFESICIACGTDGYVGTHTGEINRFSGDLHLQYDGSYGVTMFNKLRFYAAGGNTYLTSNGAYFTITVGSASHAVIDYAWVVTSDMRRKDVIMNAGASIEQIADAPIFYYRLKGSPETTLTLGSSAQYWQQVFPNAISKNPEGFLSMDYSAIALAAAVMTARKVQNHEDRILELERENEALRKEIETLKAA